MIIGSGVRPRWSPSGDELIYDRKNADGFFDIYVSDPNGNILRTLTEGKSGINQRSNGNAIFHPSGDHVVFVSEEDDHFGEAMRGLGDPGIGLFSNIWATDPAGSRFWKLTDMPIKRSPTDRTPAMASVNPHFTPDGSALVWTERYAGGGNHNWGRWRLKMADFVIKDGDPRLENERVVFTPSVGNYVTAVTVLGPDRFLVAGNLEGQHEFGMDQYFLTPSTGQFTNIQNSPDAWEEDASISPGGRIVYMTNVDSQFKLDFSRANWATQPRTREYWMVNRDGAGDRQRLTYFNDPSAPEYVGRRAIVAASDFSPDGRSLAGTIGIDLGDDTTAKIDLRIVLIHFTDPV
jgi:Tol biopolymer transport system component